MQRDRSTTEQVEERTADDDVQGFSISSDTQANSSVSAGPEQRIDGFRDPNPRATDPVPLDLFPVLPPPYLIPASPPDARSER